MSILSYFSTQCPPDPFGPLSRTIPTSVIAGKHGILGHSFQNGRNNCHVTFGTRTCSFVHALSWKALLIIIIKIFTRN